MALLYERSRSWRALVRATRDPRVLTLFLGAAVGGASLLAWGSQAATDVKSAETKKEMEGLKRRDYETARYANHSKEALGRMIQHVKGEDGPPPTGATPGAAPGAAATATAAAGTPAKQQIKLPGIAWHPKAVEREERARKRKQESATAPPKEAT